MHQRPDLVGLDVVAANVRESLSPYLAERGGVFLSSLQPRRIALRGAEDGAARPGMGAVGP
jgi:hypothetical protein